MRSRDSKVPLNEYITLQRGFDLPIHDRINGTVPVVASTGIVGFHDEAKVVGPGVVIGRSGSIGGGQFIKEDFWPLNTTLWVKDFKGHNPRFIYYLLKNIDFSSLNVGSGVPTLNRNHFTSIEVINFDEDEEIIIAGILGNIDDKIDLNRQINQTLEQIAQAIFKSWFVDFDPVKAKIEAKEKGEDPERAAMCAISGKSDKELEQLSPEQLEQLSKTAALFPDELEDSELGMIPKEWEIGIISDYGQVVTGKTPSTKVLDNFGGGIPFITPTDISDDTYIIKTDRCLTKQGQHAVRNCVIPKYSICVTCIGSQMGKVVINSTTSVTNQQINSILLHHDFHRFYVYLNLRMRRNELRLMGSSGSTMPIINKKTFSELSILRPPNIVAEQFHHCVHSLFYEVLLLLKEASILATLRDTLLPKLISGELRLENFTGNS